MAKEEETGAAVKTAEEKEFALVEVLGEMTELIKFIGDRVAMSEEDRAVYGKDIKLLGEAMEVFIEG